MVREDVQAALLALNETLRILNQVEETVEHARRQGQEDEKLWAAAVDAMEKAINATAASALAVNLTAEGLRNVASNQTSELLQALTRTAAGLSKKSTAGLDAFSVTQEHENVEGLVGIDEKSAGHSGSRANARRYAAASSLKSGDKLRDSGSAGNSRPPGIKDVNEDATGLNATGALPTDTTPSEKAQLIIQRLEEVANSASSSSTLNVTTLNTLAEAAQAALDVTASTKENAMQEMQGKVDMADPTVVSRAEEIAKELEIGEQHDSEEVQVEEQHQSGQTILAHSIPGENANRENNVVDHEVSSLKRPRDNSGSVGDG